MKLFGRVGGELAEAEWMPFPFRLDQPRAAVGYVDFQKVVLVVFPAAIDAVRVDMHVFNRNRGLTYFYMIADLGNQPEQLLLFADAVVFKQEFGGFLEGFHRP